MPSVGALMQRVAMARRQRLREHRVPGIVLVLTDDLIEPRR